MKDKRSRKPKTHQSVLYTELIASLEGKTCKHCAGTGRCLDSYEVGTRLRNERESRGMSLRTMAGKLSYSPAYVSDMELGRRGWTESKVAAYLENLKAI